ncbi:MAG: PAS domain S-box protein [Desulfobacteraceae bacterium]|nr:PAS domain S-box protein [Desulfobacteraceae bacterium]
MVPVRKRVKIQEQQANHAVGMPRLFPESHHPLFGFFDSSESPLETEQLLRTVCALMREGLAVNEIIYGEHGKPVDYRILEVNPAYEFITGLKRGSVVGRRASEVYGTGEPPFIHIFARVAESGETRFFKAFFPPMSKHFHVCAFSPRRGRFLCVFEDITESKENEESLREGEERYRNIFENSPVGIFQSTFDGRFITVNPELVRILGYESKAELLLEANKSGLASIYVNPEERGRIVEEAKKARDWVKLHTAFYRKDHSRIETNLFIRRIPGKGGTEGHLEGFIEDTSDRRKAEEALRDSEASYRALAENLPGIVYRVYKHGTMQFFNDMLEHLTGYCVKDLSRPESGAIASLILPEDMNGVSEAIARSVQTRNPFEVQYRLRHRDGSLRYCLEKGRPVYDSEGKLLHIDGVIFDHTEQKRLERQLRQAQKMEAIGTLAGGIAHDFNNILATILTYTEIALRDVEPSSPTHSDLKQVVNSAHRAKDLVKQILVFSRQKDSQEKHPFKIGPIIKETLKLLRASLPSTIEIRQRITSKEDIALVDPVQVHQVLINLCSNAAHAMRDKGGVLEIRLTDQEIGPDSLSFYGVEKPGPYLRLTVSDTGHGIDAETLHRIFDPYFTTKEPGQGTGLGLAVVHGIVKRHEGGIIVYSEPGRGSTFHVLLPRVKNKPQSETKSEEPIVGGTERILFIDDEEAYLRGGARVLKHLGYEITTRQNGLDALELFRSRPDGFDLVITDYTMPKMTGFDLAMQIKQIRSDIPVVLCSGLNEFISNEKMEEAGIDEVAMKPLGMNDFASVIRKALDAHR